LYTVVLAHILNVAFICAVSTVALILVLHCFSMFDAWCYNRTIRL